MFFSVSSSLICYTTNIPCTLALYWIFFWISLPLLHASSGDSFTWWNNKYLLAVNRKVTPVCIPKVKKCLYLKYIKDELIFNIHFSSGNKTGSEVRL